MYRRIRDLREDADKLQKEVAAELKTNVTQYQRYETGTREPPFSFIIDISNYYDVSIDYIAEKTKNKKGIFITDLNEKEQKLISIFREMTREEQGRLLERAETIIEANEGNTENKDVG